MFNAQIRADIETLDVTINNYERMANAPEAWGRIKKLVEAQNTSNNSKRVQYLCNSCRGFNKCSMFLNRGIRALKCNVYKA